jgi:hypothetical protein
MVAMISLLDSIVSTSAPVTITPPPGWSNISSCLCGAATSHHYIVSAHIEMGIYCGTMTPIYIYRKT